VKILIDSSGWIEFFSGGRLSDKYLAYIKDQTQLITPTIVLYEVYKKIKKSHGEETGLLVIGQLSATQVVPLTESIALLAADISLQYNLAMADSIVYATAQDERAKLITSDSDLKNLPNTVYFAKNE
jgi:predicted nucleic acid-binding protein